VEVRIENDVEYRALLIEYWDHLMEYRALLMEYWALLMEYWALFTPVAVMLGIWLRTM